MIVDTSVWIDHFASPEPILLQLIADRALVQHAFVTGEVSVGNLRYRPQTIRALRSLRQAPQVNEDEFHAFVDRAGLAGTGLGFVDIHILATTNALSDALIWTRDRRLLQQAERLELSFDPG